MVSGIERRILDAQRAVDRVHEDLARALRRRDAAFAAAAREGWTAYKIWNTLKKAYQGKEPITQPTARKIVKQGLKDSGNDRGKPPSST